MLKIEGVKGLTDSSGFALLSKSSHTNVALEAFISGELT